MKLVVILLAAVVLLLSASVAKQFQTANRDRENQRDQIIYLCTVARVIDPIMILRANDPRISAQLRSQFRAAHLVLSQTEPCGEVEG